MGVYIKGMDIPRNCEKCHFLSWSNFYQVYICTATRQDNPVLFDNKQVKSTDIVISGRADNCPIIPLNSPDNFPVVRCINCRYGWPFFDVSMPGGPYILCGKPYAAPRETHKFNYFCADGKKKEVVKDND